MSPRVPDRFTHPAVSSPVTLEKDPNQPSEPNRVNCRDFRGITSNWRDPPSSQPNGVNRSDFMRITPNGQAANPIGLTYIISALAPEKRPIFRVMTMSAHFSALQMKLVLRNAPELKAPLRSEEKHLGVSKVSVTRQRRTPFLFLSSALSAQRSKAKLKSPFNCKIKPSRVVDRMRIGPAGHRPPLDRPRTSKLASEAELKTCCIIVPSGFFLKALAPK